MKKLWKVFIQEEFSSIPWLVILKNIEGYKYLAYAKESFRLFKICIAYNRFCH